MNHVLAHRFEARLLERLSHFVARGRVHVAEVRQLAEELGPGERGDDDGTPAPMSVHVEPLSSER